MSRAETFLHLYNVVDDHLRELAGIDRRSSFADAVVQASRRSATVDHFARDLREFAELRNAIVHEHRSPPWVAEPSEQALAEFEAIAAQILRPEPLIPRFQRETHVFHENELLFAALRYMRNHDYSQVVVRRSGSEELALLTSEGIARWVGNEISPSPASDGADGAPSPGSVAVDRATVGEVLRFEQPGGFAILARTASEFDAREIFLRLPARGQERVFAIIITANGEPNEEPLGLITPWDILLDEHLD